MPIALVRSISLPNLKIYTTISLLLVSGCLYYAFDVVRTDPQWKLHHNTSYHSPTRPSSLLKSSNDAIAVLTNSDLLSSLTSSLASVESEKEESLQEETTGVNGTSSFTSQLKDVVSFMTHEPVCIWVSQGIAIKSRLSICAYFGVADKKFVILNSSIVNYDTSCCCFSFKLRSSSMKKVQATIFTVTDEVAESFWVSSACDLLFLCFNFPSSIA